MIRGGNTFPVVALIMYLLALVAVVVCSPTSIMLIPAGLII